MWLADGLNVFNVPSARKSSPSKDRPTKVVTIPKVEPPPTRAQMPPSRKKTRAVIAQPPHLQTVDWNALKSCHTRGR